MADQTSDSRQCLRVAEKLEVNMDTPDLPAYEPRIPKDKVEILSNKLEIPVDKPGIPAHEQEIPTEKRRLSADTLEIPTFHLEIPEDEQEHSDSDLEIPTDEPKFSADKPAVEIQIPADGTEVSAGESEIHVNNLEAPKDASGIPANQQQVPEVPKNPDTDGAVVFTISVPALPKVRSAPDLSTMRNGSATYSESSASSTKSAATDDKDKGKLDSGKEGKVSVFVVFRFVYAAGSYLARESDFPCFPQSMAEYGGKTIWDITAAAFKLIIFCRTCHLGLLYCHVLFR